MIVFNSFPEFIFLLKFRWGTITQVTKSREKCQSHPFLFLLFCLQATDILISVYCTWGSLLTLLIAPKLSQDIGKQEPLHFNFNLLLKISLINKKSWSSYGSEVSGNIWKTDASVPQDVYLIERAQETLCVLGERGCWWWGEHPKGRENPRLKYSPGLLRKG